MAQEGFIHLSTPEQAVTVANARFAGADDLVLLCLDPGRLVGVLRYEPGEPDRPDELFPHLYGPLNLDAVVRVVPFLASNDGAGFALPAEARTLP